MGLLKKLRRLGRGARGTVEIDDTALLDLLRRDRADGWRLFLDRYSGHLLAWIQDFGFDHDESMDRFVEVCERLAEDDCRRLRQVRHLGRGGELVPWLRQVVRNLLINWAWSTEGRPRLLKAIEPLGSLEQRIFHLHFWDGLAASEIHGRLRSEGVDVAPIAVFEALDAIQRALSAAKRWRLVSRLLRRRGTQSLESSIDGDRIDPPSTLQDPESRALATEARQILQHALSSLSPRQQLVIRLHYDDWQGTAEIAALLGENPAAIRRQLRRALDDLRRDLPNVPRRVSA